MKTQHRPVTVLHQVILDYPDLVATTKTAYLRAVDRFVEYAGENPSNWTNRVTQSFYKTLLDSGLRAQSANAIIAGVAYASKWWSRGEGRPELNFGEIKLAQPGNFLPKESLEPDEAIKLLNTTRPYAAGKVDAIDIRDRAMIIVGLETGMRRMSMSTMLLENISTKPYPNVEIRLKGKALELEAVPLTDVAYQALTEWIAVLRKTPNGQNLKTGPVFRQLHWAVLAHGANRGKRVLEIVPQKIPTGLTGQAIYKIVQKRAADAGIRPISPHLFRHSFVTWRVLQDMTPQLIASITHHTFGVGALEGYMDKVKLGGQARQVSPPWLVEWMARSAA